ncbi:hypothetical protein FK178_12985 [Antarcticibacterium arcticum]|uniref:Lipoprotein n=1 Tax=Antarcticibacterium arcticum TaxID=2585771 RepID=A0A5B8YLI2_9FLAO|nr:hypothetical protein [Antarcticibacterium arcticum]QED38575.1 hypothetical protein FK178_12985 [Antarcticibacterium arcticum]
MKILLSFFLFVGVFASCEQLANEAEVTSVQLEQELDQIKNFIAKTNCSGSTDCRFIAFGSKACGGPQGYLLYSSGIDEEALKKMVAQYTAAEDKYNKANGIISDCSLPTPPSKMGCEDGKCIQTE